MYIIIMCKLKKVLALYYLYLYYYTTLFFFQKVIKYSFTIGLL